MADLISSSGIGGTPAAAGAARAVARGSRTSARFVVCVGILLVSAASMEAAAKYFGALFSKQAVPLKKPLSAMDKRKLDPEYTLHIQPPAPLPEESIQALGTSEYLNWIVVDAKREKSDPAAAGQLFITYYTGQPDMVPHVPDECYVASGFAKAGETDLQVKVEGVGAVDDMVPVRMLTFERAQPLLGGGFQALEKQQIHVMYFFHTNGQYATTRNQVRLIQANLSDKYAYYAKIEVTFTDYDRMHTAGRDEAIGALQPLLRKIMPILLNDHFQDWNELKRESKTGGLPPA